MARQLHRRFNPLQLLLISINGMVGSAWLFAPLYAAQIAGAHAIIAWLLGGAATAIIALTFAEVSTLVPLAGGSTELSLLSQGRLTSYMVSWISWLSCVTMPPIEVQATLQYSSIYFPSLMHHTSQGVFALSGIGMIAATLLMLMLCIINIASFRGLVTFNFILFSFKILVILLTISLLINHRFNTSNFIGATTFSGIAPWGAILSAVASGGIAFAFTGFKHGVELAGEAKQPHIAIPLGILGSVIACLLIYLGLQIAFIGALDPKMIAKGWAHLSFTGDTGPFVGLALLLGLTVLAKLLYIDAAVSPMGAGLIYVTSTARIIYAMSKNGYLPKFLSGLNRKHFPIWAIFFNFLVGMFLFLPLPGWQNMVSFLVSAVVISYAMGPVSLLALRRQLPLEHRSFRLPFANFFSYIAFFSCNLLSYWTGWATVSKLAVAMIIGAVFLLLAIRKGRVMAQTLGLRAMVWMVPYLGGLVLISYLGSFGGIRVIPFGWDFLVIAIFSAVILTISVKARSEETEAQFAVFKASNFATG